MGRGTTIEAYNTVIGDCGNCCVELLYEGSYSFNHCTLANYWYSLERNQRENPAVYIKNYFSYQDNLGEVIVNTRDIEQADFTNCIIHGSRNSEILVSKSNAGILNYKFANVLTRFDENEVFTYQDESAYDYTTDPNFINIINNENPLFDSLHVSYELDSLSPAIDAGLMEYAINYRYDKKGDDRLADDAPDLGAFERIEE